MIHRGFVAEVRPEGSREKFEEYQPEINGNSATCYIPSESGKNFYIRLKEQSGHHDISAKAFVDGRNAGSVIVYSGGKSKIEGVRTSPNVLQPFQFAPLVMLDDDNVPINNPNLEDLGVITLEVQRVRISSQVHRPTTSHTNLDELGPVHEKSKKAGSHCVSMGQPRQYPESKTVYTHPLYPGEGTYATLHFRYRPRALLQAQGIISAPVRAPEPEPGAREPHVKRERSDAAPERSRKKPRVSHEEIDLTREVSAPRLKLDSGKDAKPIASSSRKSRVPNNEVIGLTESEVKRERSPIQAGIIHGAIIDLTEDD